MRIATAPTAITGMSSFQMQRPPCWMKNSADRIDRGDRPVIITTRYTIKELNHPQTDLEQKVFPILLTRAVPFHIQGNDRRKK